MLTEILFLYSLPGKMDFALSHRWRVEIMEGKTWKWFSEFLHLMGKDGEESYTYLNVLAQKQIQKSKST